MARLVVCVSIERCEGVCLASPVVALLSTEIEEVIR